LDERLERIASAYAESAGDYDRQLTVDCAYRTPDVVARVVGAEDETHRWLDLGAGTGLAARALRRAGTVAALYALDLSMDMLLRTPPCLYQSMAQADATWRLPYADASFDGVVAASLTEHVIDTAALLVEIGRVLVRGGRLVITFVPNEAGGPVEFEPLAGHLSHDAASVRQGVQDASLQILREIDFDAYRSGPGGWVKSRLVIAQKPGPPSEHASVPYACPSCGGPLDVREHALDCVHCERRYPVSRGIVCLRAPSYARRP
jgi:predicted TPR repeat methyltransferase